MELHLRNRRRCCICRREFRRQLARQGIHALQREDLERNPGFADYVLNRIILNENENREELQYFCHRCWVAANRAGREQPLPENANQVEQELQQPPDDANLGEQEPLQRRTEYVALQDYKRAVSSARRCFFSGCHNNELHRIPLFIRRYLLVKTKQFLSRNCRVCRDHYSTNDWFREDIGSHFNITTFNANHINEMLDIITSAVDSMHLDFTNIQSIEENELFFWTGLNHQQFNNVLNETPSLNERCAKPNLGLGIYLTKLRTGEPNERLANLFKTSRRTLERNIKVVRECLLNDFVQRHLGYDHISRDEVIRRNLTVPKELFCDGSENQALVILDGTYIYIQKSGNFLFQKESYSLHKYRNLLKPFLIVCSDGYIIDVTGPFAATTSDATIMNEMISQNSPLLWFLQENDVIIVDRGFRDAVQSLESCGFKVFMPATKNPNEAQLTTAQANASRQVTIVRWVIETVNGKFKSKFKLLRNQYFNRAVPHLFEDFRIAAALINCFSPSYRDNNHAQEIVRNIRANRFLPNKLADYVDRHHLNNQRALFSRMTAESINRRFPSLTQDDLFLLGLGSYQLKLARSYCKEHMRGENGVYKIEVCDLPSPEDFERIGLYLPNSYLIRGRIHSRHIRRKIYYCYIVANEQLAGLRGIHCYYCTCLTGRKTVGTCAHIMSIIWFLGYGRYVGFSGPADELDPVLELDV